MPTGFDWASLKGAYAHVLGCVENDVNSQLTKIMSVDASNPAQPLVSIYFRNSFNIKQRYYLENVKHALGPGDFYVDEEKQAVYIWLAEGMAPPGSGSGGASSTTPTAAAVIAAAVIAPVTDTLITMDNASHVVISNMSFTDLTYYADGYYTVQNVLYYTI
jgi:hypothetical protein